MREAIKDNEIMISLRFEKLGGTISYEKLELLRLFATRKGWPDGCHEAVS